jgi:hypothetical protein
MIAVVAFWSDWRNPSGGITAPPASSTLSANSPRKKKRSANAAETGVPSSSGRGLSAPATGGMAPGGVAAGRAAPVVAAFIAARVFLVRGDGTSSPISAPLTALPAAHISVGAVWPAARTAATPAKKTASETPRPETTSCLVLNLAMTNPPRSDDENSDSPNCTGLRSYRLPRLRPVRDTRRAGAAPAAVCERADNGRRCPRTRCSSARGHLA